MTDELKPDESLEISSRADEPAKPADLPAFLKSFAEKYGTQLSPKLDSPEWQRVQSAQAALTRHAKTVQFKTMLGELNELIDQCDLEAEGHGMSLDLSKLVDEMAEAVQQLKVFFKS